MSVSPALRRIALMSLPVLILGSCFDKADRWLDAEPGSTPLCELGERRCVGDLQVCEEEGGERVWRVQSPCSELGLVCVTQALECRPCQPGAQRCEGAQVWRCDDTGSTWQPTQVCDTEAGTACREGSCVHLCGKAVEERSNVGCEYWAVDLDNAFINDSLNAAGQQFAVVISNPEPDVHARVEILQDDTPPGSPGSPWVIAQSDVPPLSLRVFRLGPREVDGSGSGEFDAGSHTALTRAAYQIRTSVPVVAYQFNPLENVNVFSNDASLLKPVEALVDGPGELRDAYVVLGWPQTIASTDDPSTNFNPRDPTDLRAFLTIVGTRPQTQVEVHSRAVVAPGSTPQTRFEDGILRATLGPHDVLNIETDDFNADFTGSIVRADQPVVVFSGSEASDAPFFDILSNRHCCADHLEEQLDPIRTAGRRFVASVSANRSQALAQAGSTLGVVDQVEYFRVIAATPRGARVTTTLPGDFAQVELVERGSYADIFSTHDFMLESDEPIMLSSVSPSQQAAGIPRGLPGGDPSLLIIPPLEQFRGRYVFLTPDKYSFDFIRVIAAPGAQILLDGRPLEDTTGCTWSPADGLDESARGGPPSHVVWRCQLSFPAIFTDQNSELQLKPGVQNDGVHRIDADRDVGVLVDGFDAYVSYAYAAGTQLTQIVPR